MNVRKKLVELIGHEVVPYFAERIADHLIANGVTIAEDTNVLTHADRIRAMSDEELADWIARTQIANVREALMIAGNNYELKDGLHDGVKVEVLEWLKQPEKTPVEWSKSGPCPVTPEQFDAIYNDEEEPT